MSPSRSQASPGANPVADPVTNPVGESPAEPLPPSFTVPPRPAVVRPTTWIRAEKLRTPPGAEVVIASETFQRTGSFKIRAAWHRARNSSANHLIAASSGNFGQALSCAAALLGKRASIVMPSTAARIKCEAVRRFGGEVVFTEVHRESRTERVARLAAENPGAEICGSYDDPFVIAGNGTLGVEIGQRLRRRSGERRQRSLVVVPLGGGGNASGMVLGLRAAGCPEVEVVGAEPLLGNDGAQSLRRGEIVSLPREPDTLADGARVQRLGDHNWRILKDGLGGIVEVPETAIAEAVRRLFREANLKVEPTGALAFGALLADPERFAGREVVVVVTGGNVDPAAYARILEGADSFAEAYGEHRANGSGERK